MMKIDRWMRASVLGGVALLGYLGCDGGPGSPISVDSPFDSAPPSNNGSGTFEGPFSSRAPSDDTQTPPPSSGVGEPPPGSGGGGSCAALCDQFVRGCVKDIDKVEPAKLQEALALCALGCEQASASCRSCIATKALSACDGDVCDDVCDDNPGSGGSGQGGSGPGDACSQCAKIGAACPQVLPTATCQTGCAQASSACVACVTEADTDCEKLAKCGEKCNFSGGAGGAPSGGAGCSDLSACCAQLSGEVQTGCLQVVASNDGNLCTTVLSNYKSSALCQ